MFSHADFCVLCASCRSSQCCILHDLQFVNVVVVCLPRPMFLPYVCLCFCMLEVISSFKSLRAGSQVFVLLMLFLWVILHTMWSGKILQLLCILPIGMLCLSVISMMFVKIMLAVCMLV